MIKEIRGFYIEPTNICTLKCSECARTKFIDQWPQHWKNHSLNIDSLLQFLDIDLNGKLFGLGGNYGDPIYHPDFINFVKRLKSTGAIIKITTNGSYRTQDWWQELVNNLTEVDTVIFSVDGTPENFTKYRVNGDWQSIQIGMNVVANSYCNSVWKYIPFGFNQYDIEQVKQLSQDLGIKQFQVEFSDRFNEKTQELIPDASLLGSLYTAKVTWKDDRKNKKVNPACQDSTTDYGLPFISADGHYTPCCWIADHRFYYKTLFGKNKNQYDIKSTTLSEILKKSEVIDFYQTLDNHPVCQFNCPNTH